MIISPNVGYFFLEIHDESRYKLDFMGQSMMALRVSVKLEQIRPRIFIFWTLFQLIKIMLIWLPKAFLYQTHRKSRGIRFIIFGLL